MLPDILDPVLLEEWGYLVILVVTFLEAIPFVGLAVPGQLAIIGAGILASQGLLDVRRLILVAIVGGLAGQAVGYFLGVHVGRPLLDRFGPRFKITKVEVEKTEALFLKHGAWAVFLGHFSFLTRGLVNLMAGVSRYPPRIFWPVTVVAVLVWSIGYVLLGFLFGHAYARVAEWLGNATLALAVVALVVAVGWYAVRRSRGRHA